MALCAASCRVWLAAQAAYAWELALPEKLCFRCCMTCETIIRSLLTTTNNHKQQDPCHSSSCPQLAPTACRLVLTGTRLSGCISAGGGGVSGGDDRATVRRAGSRRAAAGRAAAGAAGAAARRWWAADHGRAPTHGRPTPRLQAAAWCGPHALAHGRLDVWGLCVLSSVSLCFSDVGGGRVVSARKLLACLCRMNCPGCCCTWRTQSLQGSGCAAVCRQP